MTIYIYICTFHEYIHMDSQYIHKHTIGQKIPTHTNAYVEGTMYEYIWAHNIYDHIHIHMNLQYMHAYINI